MEITREQLLARKAELQESERILLNNLNAHVGAIGEIDLILKAFEAENEPVPNPAGSPKVTKG